VPPPLTAAHWNPDRDNDAAVTGRLLLGNAPVTGARLRVGGYELPPTNDNGEFTYLVDTTVPARYSVSVADLSKATAGGAPLADDVRSALSAVVGVITVAYRIADLSAKLDGAGNVVLTGRVTLGDGSPVPQVRIYSYRLTGRVVDGKGRPVVGALVSTRTNDRDYWTVSNPTDENGNYTSLFTASDESGDDPVPFAVRVAKGDDVFEFLPDENVYFRRLQSAEMDIQLPPAGFAMALPDPRSFPGAVYQGVIVGVAVDGKLVHPIAARWPDAQGRFELTLPASLRGKSVSFWQAQTQLFSRTTAQPGGEFDVAGWPTALEPDWPQDTAALTLPS
jgi:hypothetical protein